jgi:ATP-dependent protease Clp ATPase subunit
MCISVLSPMLEHDHNEEPEQPKEEFRLELTPHEIYDALSRYVIGQDYAKKVLSVAVLIIINE